MKNIFILMLVIFCGCTQHQTNNTPSSKQTNNTPSSKQITVGDTEELVFANVTHIKQSDMHYIFVKYYGESISVVNVTKDSLEVEAYKRILKQK